MARAKIRDGPSMGVERLGRRAVNTLRLHPIHFISTSLRISFYTTHRLSYFTLISTMDKPLTALQHTYRLVTSALVGLLKDGFGIGAHPERFYS